MGQGAAEVLRLTAEDHAACTRISIPDAVPGRTYRVRMDMRTVEGKRPEVCLWQIGTDGCDLVPRAPIDDDWIPFDEIVTVDEVATGLQVVLYANVGVRHELTTVTEYRDVSITAIDPVLETTVFPPEVVERDGRASSRATTPSRSPAARRARRSSRSDPSRTASTPGR